MPFPCFSYTADMPPGIRNPRTMPHACFSYLAEVPRSMPFSCFSYPAHAPLDGRNRNAAQPTLPDLRKMPAICFRY
jgi:hypothetical protein